MISNDFPLNLVSIAGALVVCFALNANAEPSTSSCKDYSRYPDVSVEQVKMLVKEKKAFIVDVNSEESFKKNHVDTAIHFGTQEAKYSELLPKDKSVQIIAYCGGPSCTAWRKAAVKACELGYTNVAHMKAGIKGWSKHN